MRSTPPAPVVYAIAGAASVPLPPPGSTEEKKTAPAVVTCESVPQPAPQSVVTYSAPARTLTAGAHRTAPPTAADHRRPREVVSPAAPMDLPVASGPPRASRQNPPVAATPPDGAASAETVGGNASSYAT